MGQNWDVLWEEVLAHPPGETLFPLSSEIVLRATLGVAIYAILIVLQSARRITVILHRMWIDDRTFRMKVAPTA